MINITIQSSKYTNQNCYRQSSKFLYYLAYNATVLAPKLYPYIILLISFDLKLYLWWKSSADNQNYGTIKEY